MTALLIFAAYLLLEKLMDVLHSMYQMRMQVRVQEMQNTVEIEEPEKEDREIGFQSYGGTMMRVEDDEE